jgi:predicted ATP-grasp superfamily ATP-dependent carboligase
MVLETARTVLIHEWVSGGGLAGAPLPPSWVTEGRAMRRAIAGDFASLPGEPVRVIVTSDARLADDPGPWTTVRIAAEDDPSRLHNFARTADFTVLIAPETNGILASVTHAFERAGARLLGSTASAVEQSADKARLAARLRALSIETPPTRIVIPGAGLPSDTRYPAVIKPLDGAGTIDTFYLADAASLPAAARALTRALLQPFVPGTPMSASFLVDRRGRPWLIGFGAQRMAIRDGQFEYRGGTVPVACPHAARQVRGAIEAVAGLCGFVGVDFVWDAAHRRATVLEINPRPTTSYVGLCRLLPRGMLAQAWLSACDPAVPDRKILAGMAKRVHTHQCVSFDASGSLIHDDMGVVA